MIVWRLCRHPFADLKGDGARLYGVRWNSPGRPMVYLAEHPALAALEVRVHLDLPLDLIGGGLGHGWGRWRCVFTWTCRLT